MLPHVNVLLHSQDEVESSNMQWDGMLVSSVCCAAPAVCVSSMCFEDNEEQVSCSKDFAIMQTALMCLCVVPMVYSVRNETVRRKRIQEDEHVTGCISMFCWPCALAQIEDTLTSSHYAMEDLEH